MNLLQKINNMLTRSVIKLVAQDEEFAKTLVQVSGLADELRSDVEMLQQYGLKSIPLPGAKGILLAYAGNKDNASVINVDDKRYGRFELQPGDVCLYSRNGAHTIWRGDDIIENIPSAGTKTITIGGMTLTLSNSGLVMTGGDITTDGEVTADSGGTPIAQTTHKHGGSATAPDGPVTDTGTPIP